MKSALFWTLVTLSLIYPGPSAAQSQLNYKALAKEAAELYNSGNAELAADKTLEAILAVEKGELGYSLEAHFNLIKQYLMLNAQNGLSSRRDAALELQPHFRRLAIESKLNFNSILDLGNEITSALAEPNSENLESALRWKTQLYGEIRSPIVKWAEGDAGDPNRATPIKLKEPKFDGINRPEEIVLTLDISKKGNVIRKSVRVIASSNPEFEKPFMSAIKQWKFNPKTVDGKASPQSGKVIKFNIEP